MCLAVPSKIIQIDENAMAIVDVEGVRKDVSLMLLDDAEVGDYVIVHAGFAISRIDEKDAAESLRLIREALSLEDETGKKIS